MTASRRDERPFCRRKKEKLEHGIKQHRNLALDPIVRINIPGGHLSSILTMGNISLLMLKRIDNQDLHILGISCIPQHLQNNAGFRRIFVY
jgi:hypothetical protein